MNRLFVLSILVLLSALQAIAQPGALDFSFHTDTAASNGISVILIQPDKKILIGGGFIKYNNMPINGVARLNTDGSLDTTFNPGTNIHGGTMFALALQPDGKVVVGGEIADYNGTPAPWGLRLNSNGTLDTGFHAHFNNTTRALALQPDGKILAGGEFTAYNGTPVGHFCRLNSDGSLDTSFHTTPGADQSIEDIVVRPDGKIFIAGDFNYYNGTNYFRIVLVNTDGSIDSSFVSYPGADKVVYDLEYTDSSRLLAVGNFNFYEAQFKNRLIRLNPDGLIDPMNRMSTGANSQLDVVKNTDEYILVGGNLTAFNDYGVKFLARLRQNGEVDSSFNSGAGPNGEVYDIALQSDNKILVAGSFNSYDNIPRGRIARLYNCLTPQPDSIYGIDHALCSGTQQTYSVTPVSGATKYQWTLPQGWTGSSDSASIIATSTGTGGTISVQAFTDSCGYSYVTSRTISTMQPPGVNICLVTVDTQSTHNVIIWEKPVTSLIDSFFIYRETTTNVYTKIAAVPYDSLSEYHDYAANPNVTSYRYKLSVLDTCGAESDFSQYHNTIHLQYLGNGNFQWTFYQIENQSNPVVSFNLYRDAFANGSFFQIGSIPGTNSTYTDLTWSSFPNAEYVIDVNWGIGCSPTRAQVNTTRSNKRPGGFATTGITESELQNQVTVYPNPAHESINIHLPQNTNIKHIQLFNTLGQIVAVHAPPVLEGAAEGGVVISLTNLPKGIYTLCIETDAHRVIKKVVLQ